MSVGTSMLEWKIEEKQKVSDQSVARAVLLLTQNIEYTMRNTIIRIIAVSIQNQPPLCRSNSLGVFGPEQGFVLRGSGVPLLFNPSCDHSPHPRPFLPTCNPAVSLCSS